MSSPDRLWECGEDLLVDLSEVLFNELAFFRLMQDLDTRKAKVKASSLKAWGKVRPQCYDIKYRFLYLYRINASLFFRLTTPVIQFQDARLVTNDAEMRGPKHRFRPTAGGNSSTDSSESELDSVANSDCLANNDKKKDRETDADVEDVVEDDDKDVDDAEIPEEISRSDDGGDGGGTPASAVNNDLKEVYSTIIQQIS